MMERIHLVIEGATSAETMYVASQEGFRLVGMIASTEAAQSGAATVKAGLSADTDHIFEIDFNGEDAGTAKRASYGDSVTDDEKLRVFDISTPLEVEVNLESAGKVFIELLVDKFLIGAKDPN